MKATRWQGRAVFAASAWVGCVLVASCSDDPTSLRPCHVRPAGDGKIVIEGKVSDCPTISSYILSPQRLRLGESGQLRGLAVDTDSANLSFSWTTTSGKIGDSANPITSFQCATPGEATLTLTVSDGACQDAVTLVALCDP
jgi:hypothetical protein